MSAKFKSNKLHNTKILIGNNRSINYIALCQHNKCIKIFSLTHFNRLKYTQYNIVNRGTAVIYDI